MARSVLTRTARRWSVLAVVAALVILHVQAALAQRVCPAGEGAAARTTMRMAERSPFYLLATRWLGPVTGCQSSKDADSETLVLLFAHGGSLSFTSSPAIEVASQVLRLGKLKKPVTRPEAIEALQRTETEATGRAGCGIPWAQRRAAALASRDNFAFTGDACNCKATLQVKDGAVVGLEFSTAC